MLANYYHERSMLNLPESDDSPTKILSVQIMESIMRGKEHSLEDKDRISSMLLNKLDVPFLMM